jgi:glycine/D-amino acid oxidase-like deaminating enzyme
MRGDAIMVSARDGLPLLDRHGYQEKTFIIPRRDRRLLPGATYEVQSARPEALERFARDTVSARSAMELLRVNAEVVPAIADCDIVRAWRGRRPAPTGRAPILGCVFEVAPNAFPRNLPRPAGAIGDL